jgi:hypothetical protein
MQSAATLPPSVEDLATAYRQRGYRVILRPRGSQLPEFLRAFRPDLIAEGDEDSVVLQARLPSHPADERYWRSLAETVSGQPGWRFEMVLGGRPELTGETLGVEEIRQRLENARELAALGSCDAGVLVAWSALEAALRLLLEQRADNGSDYRPRALIARLYMNGDLSRSQYDELLSLMGVRNTVAHGLRSSGADARAVRLLEKLTRHLLRKVRAD